MGAVALDVDGNIAVGVSTGGYVGQVTGRVGDSPMIGSGGFCDNDVGGATTTGHGEAIMKTCLAFRTVNLLAQGLSARMA